MSRFRVSRWWWVAATASNLVAGLAGIALTVLAVTLLGSYVMWQWWFPWPHGPAVRVLWLVVVAWWLYQAAFDGPFDRYARSRY